MLGPDAELEPALLGLGEALARLDVDVVAAGQPERGVEALASLASAATKFIVGEPMKEATNLFSGDGRAPSGRPPAR